MRFKLHTALWSIPPPHSHAHIPSRTSAIDPRIVRLAWAMGRPAEDVEHEIHLVIARQFMVKQRFLPLAVAIKCHGEAQAFFDGMRGHDWPTDEEAPNDENTNP